MTTTERSHPMTRRAQLLASATWLLLVATALGLVWLALAYDGLEGVPGSSDFSAFAIPLAAMAVLTGSVGLLIRLRRPDNPIGRLMALGPLLMLSGFAGYAIGAYRGQAVGAADVIGGVAAAWGGAAVVLGIFMTYPAVVILFPDGRLPSRGWRVAIVPLLAVLIGGSLLSLFTPRSTGDLLPANPLAIPGLTVELNAAAYAASTFSLVASVLLAIVAIVVRFRRARGTERQQLKWLVASVALAGVLFPLSFLTDVGPAGLVDVASVVAAALIPAAIGVAILRYRLYEIDRVISRTIGWALVTAILAVVFVGVVIGLQALLAPLTEKSTLAVAVSTLVAFALFQPLRRHVQRAVDRRFDRARYDGQKVATLFGERLRHEIDANAAPGALVTTVHAAMQPQVIGIWLRGVLPDTAHQIS